MTLKNSPHEFSITDAKKTFFRERTLSPENQEKRNKKKTE